MEIQKITSSAHKSVAISMKVHKISKKLCENIPIVSTSANISNRALAKCMDNIINHFADCVDGVVVGSLGGFSQPSLIYDVITSERLR